MGDTSAVVRQVPGTRHTPANRCEGTYALVPLYVFIRVYSFIFKYMVSLDTGIFITRLSLLTSTVNRKSASAMTESQQCGISRMFLLVLQDRTESGCHPLASYIHVHNFYPSEWNCASFLILCLYCHVVRLHLMRV
jgi:hypothetical protein